MKKPCFSQSPATQRIKEFITKFAPNSWDSQLESEFLEELPQFREFLIDNSTIVQLPHLYKIWNLTLSKDDNFAWEDHTDLRTDFRYDIAQKCENVLSKSFFKSPEDVRIITNCFTRCGFEYLERGHDEADCRAAHCFKIATAYQGRMMESGQVDNPNFEEEIITSSVGFLTAANRIAAPSNSLNDAILALKGVVNWVQIHSDKERLSNSLFQRLADAQTQDNSLELETVLPYVQDKLGLYDTQYVLSILTFSVAIRDMSQERCLRTLSQMNSEVVKHSLRAVTEAVFDQASLLSFEELGPRIDELFVISMSRPLTVLAKSTQLTERAAQQVLNLLIGLANNVSTSNPTLSSVMCLFTLTFCTAIMNRANLDFAQIRTPLQTCKSFQATLKNLFVWNDGSLSVGWIDQIHVVNEVKSFLKALFSSGDMKEEIWVDVAHAVLSSTITIMDDQDLLRMWKLVLFVKKEYAACMAVHCSSGHVVSESLNFYSALCLEGCTAERAVQNFNRLRELVEEGDDRQTLYDTIASALFLDVPLDTFEALSLSVLSFFTEEYPTNLVATMAIVLQRVVCAPLEHSGLIRHMSQCIAQSEFRNSLQGNYIRDVTYNTAVDLLKGDEPQSTEEIEHSDVRKHYLETVSALLELSAMCHEETDYTDKAALERLRLCLVKRANVLCEICRLMWCKGLLSSSENVLEEALSATEAAITAGDKLFQLKNTIRGKHDAGRDKSYRLLAILQIELKVLQVLAPLYTVETLIERGLRSSDKAKIQTIIELERDNSELSIRCWEVISETLRSFSEDLVLLPLEILVRKIFNAPKLEPSEIAQVPLICSSIVEKCGNLSELDWLLQLMAQFVKLHVTTLQGNDGDVTQSFDFMVARVWNHSLQLTKMRNFKKAAQLAEWALKPEILSLTALNGYHEMMRKHHESVLKHSVQAVQRV